MTDDVKHRSPKDPEFSRSHGQRLGTVLPYLGDRGATSSHFEGAKVGYLVEYDPTQSIFQNPSKDATKDYVSGRFG